MGRSHERTWHFVLSAANNIYRGKGQQTKNEKRLTETLEKLQATNLTVLQINLLLDLIVDTYRIGRERK